MEEDWLNNELIDKFEEMLDENEYYYFDTDELNEIISYYLDVGDLPFAHTAIKYAMELHPESVDVKVKVLEYYLEINLLHEASEIIDELKDVANEMMDFIVAQARYWSLKTQHKRAIQFYEKALNFGVEEDYIHHCLGGEYLAIGYIGKALYHFKSALELDLDDDLAFYSCLQCFDDIHQHKEAVNFLNQYIDKRPYSEIAWFQLGLQYLHINNFSKALESFDYAVCINPKSISSLYQVAACYEKLEQFDKAIETYQEVIRFDDTSAYSHLKIARCYIKMGEPKKALNSLHIAIHEDPQLDIAWSETSEVYEKLESLEEAIHYLKRAIDLDVNNVGYLKRLAFLSIKLGYYEEAELTYEKIVDREPNHFLNWFGYTELLIILGEYQKAITVAQRGLKRFERAELYYQISCCEYLLNRNKKGSTTLHRARLLNPKLWDEMLLKYPILKIKNQIH
ncbi:tetratricopeptide repeat protein [Flavobacteriaceae bacterium Ap0902]|nr:tetratricopeptide repeat protein [Flavobacteriaceae bacterium Ap0902]